MHPYRQKVLDVGLVDTCRQLGAGAALCCAGVLLPTHSHAALLRRSCPVWGATTGHKPYRHLPEQCNIRVGAYDPLELAVWAGHGQHVEHW